MTYIKLFVDYLDAITPLGDAERGRLFTALLQYARTGEAPQLSGNERYLFPMMRAQVDRDEAAAAGLSEARSAAGKKGVQAKLSKASKSSKDKDKDKEKEKDEDKDEGEDIAPAPACPPTLSQVEAEAARCGCPELARPFFDYYSASGWRDREGRPVCSWRQRFQSWKLREQRTARAQPCGTWSDLASQLEGGL